MTLPRTPPQTRSRTALRDTLPNNTDSATTAESTNIITDLSAATNTAPSLEDQLLEAQERIAFAATELQKRLIVEFLLRQNSHVYEHNNPISLNQENLIPLAVIKVQNEMRVCGYIL